MRARFHLLAPALGLLLFGCDRVPTRPDQSTLPIVFTLAPSSEFGDPSHPITLHGSVTNVGRQPLTYLSACRVVGVRIVVLAPDRGNVVDVCHQCPNIACDQCVEVPTELQPGQSVTQDLVFDGMLMHCEGPYPGPAGVYSAEATWLVPAAGGPLSVTRSATFRWASAAGP